MGYLFAALYVLVYLFYVALILRLVFDWIQMFARFWRPKGVVLVIVSAIYAVTDPPMNFLRDKVPSLPLGGLRLDLGFLILIIGVSLVTSLLAHLAVQFS